jgi:hypothetical protein
MWAEFKLFSIQVCDASSNYFFTGLKIGWYVVVDCTVLTLERHVRLTAYERFERQLVNHSHIFLWKKEPLGVFLSLVTCFPSQSGYCSGEHFVWRLKPDRNFWNRQSFNLCHVTHEALLKVLDADKPVLEKTVMFSVISEVLEAIVSCNSILTFCSPKRPGRFWWLPSVLANRNLGYFHKGFGVST